MGSHKPGKHKSSSQRGGHAGKPKAGNPGYSPDSGICLLMLPYALFLMAMLPFRMAYYKLSGKEMTPYGKRV